MFDYPQKIFTIHFPNKKVYIENTCKQLDDKMEEIRDNKDHILYPLLKKYPDPEIKIECYKDKISSKDKKEIANNYIKDSYKLLNVNVLPHNYKSNK